MLLLKREMRQMSIDWVWLPERADPPEPDHAAQDLQEDAGHGAVEAGDATDEHRQGVAS